MIGRLSLAAIALLLAGCAGRPVTALQAGEAPVELAGVPFHPQAEFQCGPAALATVLQASGIAVAPAALTPEVFVPDRRGSLQAEMRATARRHGRVPVAIPPDLEGLRAALRAGAPVLVLQNLGLRRWPVWHYAVVVGLDPVSDTVILRSGTTAREVMDTRRFLRSWDGWAFTVHQPAMPPAWAMVGDWLETVAVWSRVGNVAAERAASAAAVARWPAHPGAWLAHGNALYASGDLPQAAAAFEYAVLQRPSAGGYNNLAYVLAELGCRSAASAALAQAHELGGDPAVLSSTAAKVQAASSSCRR